MIFPLMEKLKDKALSFSSGIRNRMFFCSWGEEGEGCRWGVISFVPQVYCPLVGRGWLFSVICVGALVCPGSIVSSARGERVVPPLSTVPRPFFRSPVLELEYRSGPSANLWDIITTPARVFPCGRLRVAASYSPIIIVPSAQPGLTALFGMGRGGAPAL